MEGAREAVSLTLRAGGGRDGTGGEGGRGEVGQSAEGVSFTWVFTGLFQPRSSPMECEGIRNSKKACSQKNKFAPSKNFEVERNKKRKMGSERKKKSQERTTELGDGSLGSGEGSHVQG